jgi:hypothetical protein
MYIFLDPVGGKLTSRIDSVEYKAEAIQSKLIVEIYWAKRIAELRET